MARPKKFDYDSDDFYDEILALAMQGLTDAEIADSLADYLRRHPEMEARCTKGGGCHYLTTENALKFSSMASYFLESDSIEAFHITL